MKKKLAIYPFSDELSPIIRHKNKFQNYELVYAVIPKGWEFQNELLEEYVDLFCREERFFSENLMQSVDAILLCKPMLMYNTFIFERIIALAEKHKKQIIYDSELAVELNNQMKEQWICLKQDQINVTQTGDLFSIDVPVIMVLGIGENCEKLDIQMGLYDYFNQKGYKTTLITGNPIYQMMGLYTLPDCLDSPFLTFSQQVKSLNAFVKKIELTDNPKLIILDVPGGIIKYSKMITNGFGYLPFLISNAIEPDIAVLSLYCGEYGKEHIEEIQDYCFRRYGIRVNYFHISRKVNNYDFETKKINYFSVDPTYLAEKIIRPQETMPAFNILDEQSREKVFEDIMKELQSNIAVV